MTAGKKLGIGFIGAAEIAKKNARAISLANCDIELVAVGSRTQAKADDFVASVEWARGATPHGSYDAVFADPRVDAVYIPLPSGIHLEWVKKAAAARKHILLEKPISTTLEDLEAILKVCRDAGIQLMDGTMWVHNPRAAEMRRVLEEGKALGTLRTITTSFAFSGSEHFFANDVRMHSSLDALGCLGDMGWYCIRACLFVMNYELPEYVQACPGNRFSEGEHKIPLNTQASFVWPGGQRAYMECAFDRAPVQYLEVAGTAGTMTLSDFVIPATEATCSFELRDAKFLDALATKVQQKVELPRPQEVLMWEQFAWDVQKVQSGSAPNEHWPHILEVTQRVVLAVMESATHGNKLVRL